MAKFVFCEKSISSFHMTFMTAFQHQATRTRVVCRADAVLDLPDELRKLQVRRPMLLTSARMSRTPLFGQLRSLLADFQVTEVADIPAHSSVATVQRLAALASAHQADGFVCLGGGSVCDSAKATALVLAEGEPLAQHASRFIPPAQVITPNFVREKLPIVAIPMTASGAEVTPSLGIRTEHGTKLLFWDAALASRVILIDPQANLHMPDKVMQATAMNGLAHCIEGLYSKNRSPVTDALAVAGLCGFDRAMRAVAQHPQDVAARSEMLVAAHVSGMVLASARSCLHHALCHVLGATCGIGHGEANAVILPHALRFNAPAVPEAMQHMAQALGLSIQAATPTEAVLDWLLDLQRVTGVPTRLRDVGVAQASLRGVAEHVLHERGLAYNPRVVTSTQAMQDLLMAAW
jgi:alcohol dehydrogenase class IV